MMKQMIMGLVVLSACLCPSCRNGQAPTGNPKLTANAEDESGKAIAIAKQELSHRGLLSDHISYNVIKKPNGWIVTAGNISGKQPKGQAYLPGDYVVIRIDQNGKITEFRQGP